MPIYQVRRFIKLEDAQKLELDSFTDIYICRQGKTNVGIKFRQPKKKAFGWELADLECKVSENEKVGYDEDLEKWQKYYLELPKRVKLKTQQHLERELKARQNDEEKRQQQRIQQKQRQSKKEEQKGQEMNEIEEKMRKKKEKICLAIQACLRNSKIKSKKPIIDWCNWDQAKLDTSQFQIFIVAKDKTKKGGQEIGHIKIQLLDWKIKPLFFQTHCVESKNLEAALKAKKQYGQNVSYPKLLEMIFLSNSKHIAAI